MAMWKKRLIQEWRQQIYLEHFNLSSEVAMLSTTIITTLATLYVTRKGITQRRRSGRGFIRLNPKYRCSKYSLKLLALEQLKFMKNCHISMN